MSAAVNGAAQSPLKHIDGSEHILLRLANAGISLAGRIVFMARAYRADFETGEDSYPSDSAIADLHQIARRTVYSETRKLVAKGLLVPTGKRRIAPKTFVMGYKASFESLLRLPLPENAPKHIKAKWATHCEQPLLTVDMDNRTDCPIATHCEQPLLTAVSNHCSITPSLENLQKQERKKDSPLSDESRVSVLDSVDSGPPQGDRQHQAEPLRLAFDRDKALAEPGLKKGAREEAGSGVSGSWEAVEIIPPGESDFEAFWKEYPKKVDKLDARKAFAKAVKKESAARIIQAAREYARVVQTVNFLEWQYRANPVKCSRVRDLPRILVHAARWKVCILLVS